MRLIDADKITFFDCLAKSGNSVCCHAKGIISKDGIDMQPTVEAIPIKWIKNEIGCSIGAVRDDDYDCDYDYAACILQLLDRWEKENG